MGMWVGMLRHWAKYAFFVLWGLLAARAVSADPVPMSAGSMPEPIESAVVTILSETLSIDVRFDAMQVEATLILENQGGASSVTAGFPCYNKLDAEMLGLSCKTKILVEVENVAQKLAKKKTSEIKQHWVWTMELPSKKPVLVKIRYTQPMVNDRYGIPLSGMGALTYELLTGAKWAGPIRKLEIDVKLPVETVAFITPAGYVREPGHIRWNLENFEPAGDLVIFLTPMETGRYLSAFRAKDYDSLLKNKESGQFDRKKLEELAIHFRQKSAEIYEQTLFLWDVYAVLQNTEKPSLEQVRTCLEESAALMGY